MRKVSKVHKGLSRLSALSLSTKLGAVAMDGMSLSALQRVGIIVSDYAAKSYQQAYGMDSGTIPGVQVNPGQIAGINAQFLQGWLPGTVHVVTAARKADRLLGVHTVGSWEDEEVIQEIMELIGVAGEYSDHGNIPLSSWQASYERRGLVRFEEGCQVGELEGLRSGRIGVSTADAKRKAAAMALEISRNRVAFFGYQTNYLPVYGMLNEPNLLPYTAVAAGAAGTTWDKKTRNEIIKDLQTALTQLRIQSKEAVDPTTTPLVLAVAASKVDYLATPSGAGSVVGETALDWLRTNYPNVTVESAIELEEALGGTDVFYLYAENVVESGTDGGEAMIQIVPARFRALGVDVGSKVVTEDFTNATSGTMVKRPYAVVRYNGI